MYVKEPWGGISVMSDWYQPKPHGYLVWWFDNGTGSTSAIQSAVAAEADTPSLVLSHSRSASLGGQTSAPWSKTKVTCLAEVPLSTEP